MKFMKWLSTVDGAVIDHVYQPIADRLADRSSPKQIGLFCLMGDLVAVAACFVIRLLNEGGTDPILGVGFITGPAIYWQSARGRPETNGARNPYRIMSIHIIFRLSVLLGVGYVAIITALMYNGIVDIILTFGLFCFLSYVYFEACDKRPPARRSVWISATPATTR